jgi:hypothetical protein
MKPVSWDKQLGLASPLEIAASQSGKIKSPSYKEAGLDVSHHALVSREGRGENVFLDIPFHRMSEMGILQQSALILVRMSKVSCEIPSELSR